MNTRHSESQGKQTFLSKVEVIGNKLPHPIALFAILALITVILSAVMSAMNVSVIGNTLSKEGTLVETTYTVNSLLSRSGLAYMLTNVAQNFTSYAPLGVVMVAMLGIGLADSSGYINAILKKALSVIPQKFIVPMLVFLGAMANISGDAGYVIVIPIGMMIMHSCGRHPFAGFAATLAGVSGGFSADLLITINDATLASIATEAARIVNPNYEVNAASNWFFLIAATFLLTIVGTVIVEKIIEPRLGKYEGDEVLPENNMTLTTQEKVAMKRANITLLLSVLFVVVCAIPKNSFLRNSKTGSLTISSPLMGGVVTVVSIIFFIVGVTYGKNAGVYKNHKDICIDMGKSMSSMGMFLALAIVAAQFIKYFNYTGIGTIISVAGANFLPKTKINYIILLIVFILFCGLMDLLMASASAKWTLMALIFVPMFMQMGISPELTMAAYRIADSSMNPISPVMAYLAVMIVFLQKYDKKAGIGTVWSLMLPFSIRFMLFWTILLIVFVVAGFPLGPAVHNFLV